MSANTDYYWKRIQETEANPVAAYQSRYQSKIDNLEANPIVYNSRYQAALDNILGQIQNRKSFSYDFNADPMYQMYKDQYTKLGNEAAQNAAASVSALTGGFGNSYATTAASQANQQYLTKLNEMIPELYNLAMNRYKLEGDELNNKFSVLGTAEDRDYGKYRDRVADWKDQLAYYNDAEGREYGKYRDQVGDWQNLLAYLQGAYGTQLAHDEWEAEFALKNRPVGGGGGGTSIVYINGKPVEVNDKNKNDIESTLNSLGAEAAKQFQYNDKTPRSEKINNFQNAVDKETAKIANSAGISDTNALREAVLEESLRRSGYLN